MITFDSHDWHCQHVCHWYAPSGSHIWYCIWPFPLKPLLHCSHHNCITVAFNMQNNIQSLSPYLSGIYVYLFWGYLMGALEFSYAFCSRYLPVLEQAEISKHQYAKTSKDGIRVQVDADIWVHVLQFQDRNHLPISGYIFEEQQHNLHLHCCWVGQKLCASWTTRAVHH